MSEPFTFLFPSLSGRGVLSLLSDGLSVAHLFLPGHELSICSFSKGSGRIFSSLW